MSDDVVIAIIGGTQAVIVALVGIVMARLGKVKTDTAAARHQVENDHTKNMRVEQDDRHKEITDALGDIRRDVGGIRADVRSLHSADQAVDARLQRVESALISPNRKDTP